MKIRLSCRKLNVSISSLNYHTKFNANEKKKTLERVNNKWSTFLRTRLRIQAAIVQRNDN